MGCMLPTGLLRLVSVLSGRSLLAITFQPLQGVNKETTETCFPPLYWQHTQGVPAPGALLYVTDPNGQMPQLNNRVQCWYLLAVQVSRQERDPKELARHAPCYLQLYKGWHQPSFSLKARSPSQTPTVPLHSPDMKVHTLTPPKS